MLSFLPRYSLIVPLVCALMVASQTFTVGNLRHKGYITKNSAKGFDVKLVPHSDAGILKVDPPPNPKHTVTTSFRNEKTGLYVGVKGPAHPDSILVWVTEKYEWAVQPSEEGQYVVYPQTAALLWYDGNTHARTIQLKDPDQLVTLNGLVWDIKPVHK